MYLKVKNPVRKHWVFLITLNLVLADYGFFAQPNKSEHMNISPPNASNQPLKLKSSLVVESVSIKKCLVKPIIRSFLLVSLALKKPLGSNGKSSDTFKGQSLVCKGLGR